MEEIIEVSRETLGITGLEVFDSSLSISKAVSIFWGRHPGQKNATLGKVQACSNSFKVHIHYRQKRG